MSSLLLHACSSQRPVIGPDVPGMGAEARRRELLPVDPKSHAVRNHRAACRRPGVALAQAHGAVPRSDARLLLQASRRAHPRADQPPLSGAAAQKSVRAGQRADCPSCPAMGGAWVRRPTRIHFPATVGRREPVRQTERIGAGIGAALALILAENDAAVAPVPSMSFSESKVGKGP